MKVYRSLAEFNTLECAVATTGTFDGVHLGHQKIVNQLVQTAHKVGGESVLLTFDPHPRVILQPDVELKLLSSIEEKIELLEKTGLDHLIIHPFSKEFSRTPSIRVCSRNSREYHWREAPGDRLRSSFRKKQRG